jgi:hypothetical protein
MAPTQEGSQPLPPRRINMQLRITRDEVPPLKDAPIIGKRAPIGANSISRAFVGFPPGAFTLIWLDHPVIEAILIRMSDLRKLPQQELVGRLLHQAEQIMDESDTLHIALDFEILVNEENIEV